MSLARLYAAARADVAKVVSGADWGLDINLSTPDGTHVVNVQGLNTNHTLLVDNDGNAVNSTSRHISIPESVLTELNYPVRNTAGDVAMRGHKAKVQDNNGVLQNYMISECRPNGTTGLLIFMLGLSNS
jgi:hypothetical protein